MKVVGFLLLIFISACGDGGSSSPPDTAMAEHNTVVYQPPQGMADGWPVADAGDLGISTALMTQMLQAVDDGQFPALDSLSISYQGNLILDQVFRTNFDSFDADNTDIASHRIFSVSKSFASALVGIVIDQGEITGVQHPYLSLFPYTDIENPSSDKEKMTLKDALTMRLGFAWNEFDPPYTDPDNQLIRFQNTEFDYSRSLLDLPVVNTPGSVWAYNTITSVTLGQAVENATPLMLDDFMMTYLFEPLQIINHDWVTTPTGLPHLGSGLFLTTRDMAKLGQVYVDGGTWQGREIVSQTWVNESLKSHANLGSDRPGATWELSAYGYQWWLGYFNFDSRQVTAHAAMGYGAQNIWVIPAFNLVIANHGNNYQGSRDGQIEDLIVRYILPAIPEGN